MKKMPCLFVRKFVNNRIADITPEVTPGCEWVLAGEGVATRKWDGTACMIRDGKLYARYDAKKGKQPPAGAIPCDPQPDPVTGHWPHWVEVADQPQFRYIREAYENSAAIFRPDPLPEGTWEACGPKINSNKERRTDHMLLRHDAFLFNTEPPRDFDGLKAYLAQLDAEGIVFHHPDGRMCKIRRNDFGYAWPPEQP